MSLTSTPCAVCPYLPQQSQFSSLLSKFQSIARFYFRDVRCPQQKDDHLAESVALGRSWFCRLVERGRHSTRQGQPPVCLEFQPNVPLPSPPTYAITPDPAPGAAYELRIPVIGLDSNNDLLGHYDGTIWRIRSGVSQLEIDVGSRKETVTVTFTPPSAMNPSGPIDASTVDSLTGTATAVIRVTIASPHHRGSIMRLVAPDPLQPASMPGNPGPQSGFNYKAPRYSW